MGEQIRCQDCGQPLSSWAEPHSWKDCEWWRATQSMRDMLVAVGRLNVELAALSQKGERDGE